MGTDVVVFLIIRSVLDFLTFYYHHILLVLPALLLSISLTCSIHFTNILSFPFLLIISYHSHIFIFIFIILSYSFHFFWQVLTIFVAMESLSLQSSSHIKALYKATKLNPPSPCELRGIKQVGFPCFWRQRSHSLCFSSLKCQAFTPHASDSTPTPTPADGPSSALQQNDEGQKGHLIGPVEDSSGSIVEFRLFSQSEHGNSNVSATLGLDKQDDEEFEVHQEEGFGEDRGKFKEATLSKSSINGTLVPDKQDEDQELSKEDGADENEREVRETTVSEGEENSSAGIPLRVSLDQGVANKSEIEAEISGETDDEVLGKLLTKVKFSIVFVTAEAAPYSKTGGLGDVCGSLPIALADHGHRVMVVCPRYIHGTAADKIYAGAFDAKCRIKVNCFGGAQEVAFFHEYRDGVDWVFVDHPSYHRPGNPYGDSFGAFGDNQFRFTLLCHAACEAPLVLPLGGYTYGEKCLFLVNDWHAGLVPVLLAAKYRPYGVYKDARSILVIHNLFHQGVEPAVTYDNLGLPPQWYGALEWVFPEWARAHALDKGEAVNILKGAIVTSDRILTVSQGYSWEITTVEGGYGLHELLAGRKFVLNGIINGINVSEWDPSDDPLIAAPYSVDDLSGKAECKAALQKELGLPIKPNTPLIGFIGRLDYQKGIDIIQEAFPQLMEDDVQFVMLGSGDSRYETWMRAAEGSCRDKFRGWIGFSIPISHRITAGCDILLMPSRFEPCGLNQLYAMRYGTVPVVHCTGGLRDTVETYNPFAVGPDGTGTGTGWAFSPLTKESMLSALRNAIITYRNYKESWEGLMKRGMRQDFTWDSAAAQYEQVFEWAFTDPPYC